MGVWVRWARGSAAEVVLRLCSQVRRVAVRPTWERGYAAEVILWLCSRSAHVDMWPGRGSCCAAEVALWLCNRGGWIGNEVGAGSAAVCGQDAHNRTGVEQVKTKGAFSITVNLIR